MDDEAPTDLQRLKAMVAQLETADRPMVAWMSIYFHAFAAIKRMRAAAK